MRRINRTCDKSTAELLLKHTDGFSINGYRLITGDITEIKFSEKERLRNALSRLV